MTLRAAAWALGGLALLADPAAPLADGAPEARGAWARATVEGMRISGAFLEIANPGPRDALLVGADSDAADAVEIHAMEEGGDGVMRMRPLEGGLAVPAGSSVTLAPGGLHLMLIGLRRPLAAGDAVPLSLRFEGGGTVRVEAEVREAGDDPGRRQDHDHHHDH